MVEVGSNFNVVNMKQTAVEFLAEKYNYITWLRNRDEISAGTADEWRDKFLKEAKEMEKQAIIQALNDGKGMALGTIENKSIEQYYNQTFKSE